MAAGEKSDRARAVGQTPPPRPRPDTGRAPAGAAEGAGERETLSQRIEAALLHEAAIDGVFAEIDGGRLILSGAVSSAEQRATATELARRLAPDLQLDNDLAIEQIAPASADDLGRAEPSGADAADELADLHPDDRELVPDLTNQPLMTDAIGVIEDADEVYFPPTDPVVTVTPGGDVQVLGGLAPTGSDAIEVAPSTLDSRYGDEALADAVRDALRRDATTTALRVQVEVDAGVARLRGRVPDLDDAENAEAVAGAVPGIVEVNEELVVNDI